MTKVLYIDGNGGHTEDAGRAIFGGIREEKELRSPRFDACCDGVDLLYIERDIGLIPIAQYEVVKPKAEKKTEKKPGKKAAKK